MKSRTFGLSAALAAILAGSPSLAAEINIAVMQSLTGSAAFIGTSVKDGMLYAAEEINRTGFLGHGNTLKVTVGDDGTDRTQTLSLVSRYATDPNMLAILGPTSGVSGVTAANAANDKQMLLMAIANTNDIPKAGPWSFMTTQPAQIQMPFISNYVIKTLKPKNCSVIGIHDNENYLALSRSFENDAKAAGVNIVSVENIRLADSDFSTVATKVVAQPIDCLHVSAPAPQSANIIIQLRQAGLRPDVRIFGHTSLASPQFISTGGKAVEGVYLEADWAPGGSNDLGRAFYKGFKEKTGQEADNWHAVGFSGMYIMATAIKNAGANPTRATVRDHLTKTKDVPVVIGNGLYSYDDNRIPHFGMNILQVKDGKFVPAPQ